MKRNVNKKSNNRSKVVSAVAMLMVSVLTLSTATYAWFTMSKQVEVDGIELTATAPDNVLIASNNDAYTTIAPYSQKQTLVAGTKDLLKGGKDVALATTDKLLPVSSTDGVALFQSEDIKDGGGAKDDAKFYTATTSETDAEQYYVDIPLYILTTGSKDVDVQIDEAQSTITAKAGGKDPDIYKAARFAILAGDKATNVGGTYEATNAFFTDTLSTAPVKSLTGTVPTLEDADSALLLGTDQAVDSTKITLKGTAAATANVDATYEYTPVVVRVWIEGQNSNCITANANQSFDVKLVFKAD